MKRSLGFAVSLISVAIVLGLSVAAVQAQEKLQHPIWAYAVPPVPAPPVVDDDTVWSLEGSTGHYTRLQIRGLDRNKVPLGPADWFPGDHPAMPKIVAEGDEGPGGRGIRACSLCHYPNGKGRGENALVSGQPKDYIVATLKDMRSGARKSAETAKINAIQMVDYAKGMTDAEIEDAANYFSSMPWTQWIKVIESTTAPKVVSNGGLYVPALGADAGTEPLGDRIVEIPVNARATEFLRDPHSPFIAYVPVGSIAKGKQLVESGAGGRSLPCASCHGPDLKGVATIPDIASRSPSYMARQINDYQRGTRNGPMAMLMKPVVDKLTEDDIVNITAYLASIPAKPMAGG